MADRQADAHAAAFAADERFEEIFGHLVGQAAAIVLDVDHSDDPTYGQQEFAFYNHHYQNYCYLPLFIFEGTSHALVTAYLRPGTRPPGAENAMILVRLLSYLRHHWPHTHILVRGDSHFATPEVIAVITSYLPQQMDEAETRTAIEAAIAETGAASMKDMGKVVGILRAKYAGRMDFAKASASVKRVLGG